jgi:predicted phosphoadenosine phosphosulfate sulfurtransferase
MSTAAPVQIHRVKKKLVATDGRYHRTKSAIETSVLDLARERMRECFQLFDTAVVSFSGGKDSTVVLNLAIEAARDLGRGKVLAMHFDEEAIQTETEAYVRRVYQSGDVDMTWYCLPIQHRNACSRKHPYWWPWAPEAENLWVRPMPPEATTYHQVPNFPIEPEKRPTIPNLNGLLFPAREFGRTVMLMGVRAQESLIRLGAILKPTPDSRPWIRKWDEGFSQGNIWKAYPIYDWKTEDVWTAPSVFGWDYNRAYDLMEMAGIKAHQQRVAPPYGEEPMQHLWMYATCFPDIWERMVARVPGAATAARYSRSELYGYGGRPEKPAGMSWDDFLRKWIDKHPPKIQAQIVRRIKMWHFGHVSITSDPIAVRTPHYQTGICWDFLLMLAMRGDFKERKQPRRNKEVDPVQEAKYWAEIALMREAGELPNDPA